MRGYTQLVKLLRKTKAIQIIGHQNSDPDAVCSAYAFSTLAKRINHKLTTSFTSPDGVSKLSKQILTAIPLDVVDKPDLSQADVIVTVDTNTLQQLGEFKELVLNSRKPLVMIDHHAPHPDNAKSAALILCDEKATSTCEIILDMYERLRVPVSREVSQALMTGLLVETGHMSIATAQTFRSAYLLVQSGADPELSFALARTAMDDSERIARVKSAQRVRLEHVDRWLMALSEVGSYQASAARGLVSLGAHLAVVAGQRDDEVTISFRSTRDFVDATGMHLGSDLAAPLGSKMGGMGGGHATAAGANVKGNVNDALKLAVRTVREFVSRPSKQNTNERVNAQASSQMSVTTQ